MSELKKEIKKKKIPVPAEKRFETERSPDLASVCLLKTAHVPFLSFRSETLHGMFHSAKKERINY